MNHSLCRACVHTCRQDAAAKIVSCPRYQKRLSNAEFSALVDELSDMEREADALRERAQALIQETVVRNRTDAVDEPQD